VNGLISNLAPEIVACIGEGRAPTLQELGRVADRIRAEIFGSMPVFAWAQEEHGSAERLLSYRLALVALTGVPTLDDQMALRVPA
jgi:hypothetical protein